MDCSDTAAQFPAPLIQTPTRPPAAPSDNRWQTAFRERRTPELRPALPQGWERDPPGSDSRRRTPVEPDHRRHVDVAVVVERLPEGRPVAADVAVSRRFFRSKNLSMQESRSASPSLMWLCRAFGSGSRIRGVMPAVRNASVMRAAGTEPSIRKAPPERSAMNSRASQRNRSKSETEVVNP